jgi:hypothetical protein
MIAFSTVAQSRSFVRLASLYPHRRHCAIVIETAKHTARSQSCMPPTKSVLSRAALRVNTRRPHGIPRELSLQEYTAICGARSLPSDHRRPCQQRDPCSAAGLRPPPWFWPCRPPAFQTAPHPLCAAAAVAQVCWWCASLSSSQSLATGVAWIRLMSHSRREPGTACPPAQEGPVPLCGLLPRGAHESRSSRAVRGGPTRGRRSLVCSLRKRVVAYTLLAVLPLSWTQRCAGQHWGHGAVSRVRTQCGPPPRRQPVLCGPCGTGDG